MTVPAEGEHIVFLDHAFRYPWGHLEVTVGAAALLELRPAQARTIVPVMPLRQRRIVHPPLTFTIAAAQELNQPPEADANLSFKLPDAAPDSPYWRFVLWGSMPPPADERDSVGMVAAHQVAASTGWLAADTLPKLLRQPEASPVRAIRHADMLRQLIVASVHRTYCQVPNCEDV